MRLGLPSRLSHLPYFTPKSRHVGFGEILAEEAETQLLPHLHQPRGTTVLRGAMKAMLSLLAERRTFVVRRQQPKRLPDTFGDTHVVTRAFERKGLQNGSLDSVLLALIDAVSVGP